MTTLRSTARRWVWLAWVAMLFGAMAPTVSRALAATNGPTGWIEVCTSTGARWVPLATGDVALPKAAIEQPPDTPDSLSLNHCPFCLLSAERLGLPPAPTALPWAMGHPPSPSLDIARPGCFAFRPHAWSRGPPDFS